MNKILIAFLALLITITGYAQQPIQHSNSPFAWLANILGTSHAPGKSEADATKLAVASDFHESAASPKKKPSAVRVTPKKAVKASTTRGRATAVKPVKGISKSRTAKAPIKTSDTPEIEHLNSPFASIAIGYRRILGSSIDSGDRSSGAYRLALGYYFLEHEKFGLSAELGIMNDDRVKLKMLSDGTVPNMTLRPPIDLLFGVHGYYKRFMPYIKFGATYEQIRFDYPNIPNQDGWLPTIHAGIGWLFNSHAEFNLYYQRTFGENVSVAPCEGSCTYHVKDRLPSMEGIFLAFLWRLA